MNNSNKKSFLLAGLIFNIVCFILLAISSSINIFYTFIDWDSTSTADAVLISATLVNILLIIISLVGVVLSSICLTRTNLQVEQFHSKRFLILSTFILDVVVVVLSVIYMRIVAVDILTLFITLALICASVFIYLDYNKNKQQYKKQKSEDNK